MDEWISVGDHLPAPDVWVQVFEDDNENAQDAYLGKLFGSFRYRATPAMLLGVDQHGYPDWYLCYVGGGPVRHVRNVTHWKPLSEPPKKSSLSVDRQFEI